MTGTGQETVAEGRAARVLALLRVLSDEETVRGADLAATLKTSVRTVYRDIALLRAQGIAIAGDPGVGYALGGKRVVPAMSLTADEADALALGLRMAHTWGDPQLSKAAADLHARLPDALRPDGQRRLQRSVVVAPFSSYHVDAPQCLPALRRAARQRLCLDIDYTDGTGNDTQRRVRPLSIAFFAPIWILTVWCELRSDFRDLRADRIRTVAVGPSFTDEPGRTVRDYLARSRDSAG
ncbi:MAG: YafY family protein [Nocardioides sp.]|uniref:helix-turn-helix transcriptional regulator n=1 Tax=Nocardioides sp. TaxID=35761 RepID=UPI0039E5E860